MAGKYVQDGCHNHYGYFDLVSAQTSHSPPQPEMWLLIARAFLQYMRKRAFCSLSLAATKPSAGTAAAGAGSVSGGELCLQWPSHIPIAEPGAAGVLSSGLGICKVH